jgi:prepilin peptidase CpaA
MTSFPLLVVLVGSLVAAATDVWKFKVYNLLTLPLLASGLCYWAYVNGLPGLVGSALGVLFGFGIMFMLYVLGGIGAGDVKLMAAIGAWLGMPLTFFVFVAGSLAAGLYALVVIVTRGSFSETWVNFRVMWHRAVALGRYLAAETQVEAELKDPGRRQRVIPFAAMLALGLVGLLACSWLYAGP